MWGRDHCPWHPAQSALASASLASRVPVLARLLVTPAIPSGLFRRNPTCPTARAECGASPPHLSSAHSLGVTSGPPSAPWASLRGRPMGGSGACRCGLVTQHSGAQQQLQATQFGSQLQLGCGGGGVPGQVTSSLCLIVLKPAGTSWGYWAVSGMRGNGGTAPRAWWRDLSTLPPRALACSG